MSKKRKKKKKTENYIQTVVRKKHFTMVCFSFDRLLEEYMLEYSEISVYFNIERDQRDFILTLLSKYKILL